MTGIEGVPQQPGGIMRISRRRLALLTMTAAAVSMSACGGEPQEQTQPETTSSTAPSTVTVTKPAPSSTEPVTDVDAAEYAVAGSDGYFRWTYASSPLRECGASPAMNGVPAGITCSAPFPDDAPEVRNDVFSGPPNAVRLTADAAVPTIVEGGPPGARALPQGRRITIGALSCTVPRTGSIECSGPTSGFTVDNGGTKIDGAPSSAASTPMDTYTEGTTPAEPGTQCGAATGKTPVKIVSGEISCAEAIEIVDGYLALPNDGSYGNANIRMHRGFSCSTATAGSANQRGYGTSCSKGDIELIVPIR